MAKTSTAGIHTTASITGLSRATTQLSDMLRGQSFRAFGLTPKSRDSISEAEVAVEEGDVTDRVGSIGAKVKRQASQRASLQKSATERLQELYLQKPAKLDIEAMQNAIAAGEEAHVDRDFLERCKLNLAEAEKIAARKREEERLARMKERCEESTAEIERLLNFAHLDVDLSALTAALQVAGELEEEEGPPTHKVDVALVKTGREFLEAAQIAHAERRKQALADLKAASSCLLTVDAETLKAACDFAKIAGVDTSVLSEASALLTAAQIRIQKAKKLETLSAAEPFDAKIDALRDAWVAAAGAGVAAGALHEAHEKLRQAETAQAERSIASARLAGLLDVDASKVDVAAVREAKALAEEASAAPAVLQKADTVLDSAAKAQMLRDVATASLLGLAAPRAPERSDMNSLRDLVPKAPGAGVSEDVVTMAKASLKEAEAAQAVNMDDKHKAHIDRLKAANKRTAESAPLRRATLEERAAKLEDAVTQAAAASAEKASEHAAVADAASVAMAKVLAADTEVSGLSGDAQASAWSANEIARKEAVDAEAAVTKALAALEVAKLVEAEASWQATKARREVGVYTQIALVITDAANGTSTVTYTITKPDDDTKFGVILVPPKSSDHGIGAFVSQPGKILFDAGICADDTILKLNGIPITDMEHCVGLLKELPAGQFTMEIVRKADIALSGTSLEQVLLNARPPKTGGCCGFGGKKPDVIDPEYPDGMEAPKDPLPLLIDEIAWSPLKLPAGSSHQIELLLAFAVGGFYSHEPICAAVATAVCAADPTYTSCSQFVLGLSTAYGAGMVRLRAGGIQSSRERGVSAAKRLSHMVSPRGMASDTSLALSDSQPASTNVSQRDSQGDGTLSRTASITQDDRAASSFKRSGSSFLGGLTRRSRSVSETTGAGMWPGREVKSEIGDEHFRLMLEVWLAKMARGSQAKGQGGKRKETGSTSSAGTAATVGKMSATIAELMRPPHAPRLEKAKLGYTNILPPLLQRHYEVTAGKADEGDEGDEAAMEAAAALADVHACIELILGSAYNFEKRSLVPYEGDSQFEQLMPIWEGSITGTAPAAALAGMARAFSARLYGADGKGTSGKLDEANERVILALVKLFVSKPESLTGFQQLVPMCFTKHLAVGTALRDEMCTILMEGGMEAGLVENIKTVDELCCEPFFWSAPGMKLFGGAADTSDPEALKQLLSDAMSQQAIIASAFLDQTIKMAATDAKQADSLPPLVATTLTCLLEHVAGEGGPSKVRRGVFLAVDTILYASATFSGALFAAVGPVALEIWKESETSGPLLEYYVESHLKPRLDKDRINTSDKDQAIIQTLCSLFITKPETLTAFLKLTPDVFDDILALGSEARSRVNNVLMSGSFEPRLAPLIADSDDFVKSSFFWAADGAMALCLKDRVASDYSKMNAATLTGKDGSELHLYSRLLALLLRLSSHRGGEISEIAFRTQEVLDQFERNPDQQTFMLTIIEKLDERSTAAPADFDELPLTVLSEVAANGVQTISSVQGEGLALCEQAMTTLLQSYIRERAPNEWKGLFKDATNIAFMVKYMFRESLDLAKEKFTLSIGGKKNFSGEALDIVKDLVKETLLAYGDVGIYDPQRLAEIDFLNKPDQLVELVAQSKNRGVPRAQGGYAAAHGRDDKVDAADGR